MALSMADKAARWEAQQKKRLEANRKLRQKKKAEGLVAMTVYVPQERVKEIRAAVHALLNQPGPKDIWKDAPLPARPAALPTKP